MRYQVRLGKMLCILGLLGVMGCANGAIYSRYAFLVNEPDWIRNGEPILFEGQTWYPQDDADVFLDSEVYLMGEYRGVQFFVDKLDVRPYDKLYTKFSEKRYRVYQHVAHD